MRKWTGLFLFALLSLLMIEGNAWAVTPKFASHEGGRGYSVAIKSDGTLWQWGYGITTPTQVTGHWIDVAVGSDHILALKSDGTVWAWGSNTYGQLGNGTQSDSDNPVSVLGIQQVVAIAAGGGQSMALTSGGTVYQWGATEWEGTSYNPLVVVNSTNVPTPVNLNGVVNSIAAGDTFKFAIKSDGSLWAWGRTVHAALGLGKVQFPGNVIQYAVDPLPVYDDYNNNNWSMVVAGNNHAIALRNNGETWSWGCNQYGQVGNLANLPYPPGDPRNHFERLYPQQIALALAIFDLSAADEYGSKALRNNGVIYSWGQDFVTGASSPRSMDGQVGQGSDWGTEWVEISKDGWLGKKSDGTLWSLRVLQNNQPTYIMMLLNDNVPGQFVFEDQANVGLNTVVTSSPITVMGIDVPTAITIVGGEYEINNSGTWTSAAGTVYNGNTVRVRQTSSAQYSTTTDAVLTIGGVSDTFSVTTSAPPATGATLSASPANAQVVGSPVVFTATGSGGSGTYEYRFRVVSNGVEIAGRSYGTSNTWTWNTTGVTLGTYTVQARVRNVGSIADYEAFSNIVYSVVSP